MTRLIRTKRSVCAVTIALVGASIPTLSLPALGADSRTKLIPKSRETVPPSTSSVDRIGQTTLTLTPTVRARRALGSIVTDQYALALDLSLGSERIGRVTGLTSGQDSQADLRYMPVADSGALDLDGYTIRLRGERIQVSVPSYLRAENNIDGYVTSVDEASYSNVGFNDEAKASYLTLSLLKLLPTVSSWALVKGSKGTKLRGTFVRETFEVLSEENYGTEGTATLTFSDKDTLKQVEFSLVPTKTAKAKTLNTVTWRGTLTPSAKEFIAEPPRGTFVSAAKLFDLAPLPETGSL